MRPFILWFGFYKLSSRDPSHGSINTDLGFVFPGNKRLLPIEVQVKKRPSTTQIFFFFILFSFLLS